MKGISRRFISIIWVTSLMVAMCLLYSCAKMTVIESEGTGTVDLYVTVEENLTHSRAIAPSQLAGNELGNYDYKLTASNFRLGEINKTVTVDTNGRTTITGIPYGTWQLKLVALNNQNQEILAGSSAVTIDYIDPVSVEFVLKPVETGNGSINITLALNGEDFRLLGTASTAKFELLKAEDYSPVTGMDVDLNQLTQTLRYNKQGIAAGTYILKLTITAGANVGVTADSIVTWTDIVYVEPYRETLVTNLTLPRLLQKPNAPSGLNIARDSTITTGHVPTTLTWTNVYNANSYVVEVLEYTTGTFPTSDQTWNVLAGQVNIVKKYNATPDDANNYLKQTSKLESQYYMDGGLLPGQTGFKLGLEIRDKVYAARIKATNDYGDSGWSYFINPQIPTAQVPTPTVPAAPTDFDFTAGHYDSATGSFLTVITWDNVANADGYELQLMKIANDTTPRDDNAWDNLVRSGRRVTSYRGDELFRAGGDPCKYEAGSLLAGSEFAHISIKRNAGREYYAVRLRVYNGAGDSPWVYPQMEVQSLHRRHPKLLAPRAFFTYTSTQVVNGNFDATITVQDIDGSTCYYQYEFISVPKKDFSNILTQTDPFQKAEMFKTEYTSTANNPQVGPKFKVDNASRVFTLRGLPAANSVIVRIRMATVNTANASDPVPYSAAPWYYTTKSIVPGQTNATP